MTPVTTWKLSHLLLHKRWPWHLLFWVGYLLFRFWPYYITVNYYPAVFLRYMLLSEILFVAMVYFTIRLYRELFVREKYLVYFLVGAGSWMLFLYSRTAFQFSYLQDQPKFSSNTFPDIFLNNIAVVIVYFLFITACKYFKDGYISQRKEAESRRQQLLAEVNSLKSQIAPHFLFNTLNNLYGLAVLKSDKLPDLILQLSELLRHSLYETQKPLVPIHEELSILKSYIQLEKVRLEDSLVLRFDNEVPKDSPHQIAPLLLIVFIENAFKHAKYVSSGNVNIYIQTRLENNWFTLIIKNNYNRATGESKGIGLANVKRRLEVLYPNWQHQLVIDKTDSEFTVNLGLQLTDSLKE